MTITEVIARLEDILEEEGDLPVYGEAQETLWTSGYMMRDPGLNSDWRVSTPEDFIHVMTPDWGPDYPPKFVRIG